ncbi:unnamed protein product, partial [Candidula unifasciata]
VHNLIGETVPITGPILLSVGALMLILAVRQFYMAHTRKIAHAKALQNKAIGVTPISAIAEQDEDQEDAEGTLRKNGTDIPGETCVSTDDKSEKQPFITGVYNDPNSIHSTCGDNIGSGDYMWPPVAIQHPYYSMAMMVYKDPTLFCSPYLTAAGHLEAINPALLLPTNANTIGYIKADEVVTGADGLQLPSSSSQQRLDSAVLETSPVSPHHVGHTLSHSDLGSHMESPKIFPADYLTQYQRGSSGVSNSTNGGINNLPNPAAFTLLRTLELQETI